MLAYGLASSAVWALTLLVAYRLPAGGPLSDCASQCPHNPLALVGPSEAWARITSALVNGVTAVGVAWVAGLLIRKARSTSSLRRRAAAPVLVAFLLVALSYLFYSVLNRHQSIAHKDVLQVVDAASSLAIPFAFLLGQVRGRAFAMAKVGRRIAMAGRDPVDALAVEVMLRDVLGDPSAQLAFVGSRRDGYVDVHGAKLELPVDPLERSVIPIARDGRPFAAVIHQPEALDDTDLVEGLTATSLMLLEHDRLLDELRASRARLAAAADHERVRIERDLHDGAQQQLIALEVRLSLLLERVDEPELTVGLRRAVTDAQTARDQLRSLAHGLYPHVLELGLGPALKTAAREAAMPVSVDDRGVGRCNPEVEAAVYFCCLEALQNAAKHAGPEAHRECRRRIALWEDRAPDHLIVSFQLIPLAVLSAITSPTAMAVVLLILRRRRPVRLLSAYVIGSFVTSVLVGIAVVAGLSATSLGARRKGAAISIFDISIGVLILVTAAWLHSGRSAALRQRAADRVARRKAQKNSRSGDKQSWSAQILSSGSVGRLATLGVVMHLPGLLYLAALGYISQRNASPSQALLLIVLFNIVMLAPIELPLLGYIVAPQKTEDTVRNVNSFIIEHRRKGLLLLSVVAGGYLIVTGIVGLVT